MSNSAPTASLSPAGLAQMVQDAERRIRDHVIETPLEPIPDLLPDHSSHIFFKLENLQQTGSFKLRGATNKILSLDR
ncbi:MAG TPA: pyridoxal-phosphate dependent enzyme, partial [Candidatus Angelobacter sp.]|nr:pyridoxal-phosphate dependent enzyme [Candidatus Angelobacter sp.]